MDSLTVVLGHQPYPGRVPDGLFGYAYDGGQISPVVINVQPEIYEALGSPGELRLTIEPIAHDPEDVRSREVADLEAQRDALNKRLRALRKG